MPQVPYTNKFQRQRQLSKTLSWALRHQGPAIGLTMTKDGYVPVAQILASQHPRLKGDYSMQDIQEIVETSDKKRFHLALRPIDNYKDFRDVRTGNTTILCIRASQGHSLKFIDEDLLLMEIPDDELAAIPVILHGTYEKAWEAISTTGLNRMKRNHMHFAPGFPKGKEGVISGMRKNCTIYIYVDGAKCARHPDVTFYRSANGVLLTAGVKNTGVLPIELFSHVTDASGKVLLDQRSTNDKEVEGTK